MESRAYLGVRYQRKSSAFAGFIKSARAHITETDQEIDALVYKLYGLTEKEIKIIEGEFKMTPSNHMKELIEKLNRLKDKVQSNPKQNYSWLHGGEFKQEYSIGNIKNLKEHEDNIQELIIWLWNFKDHLIKSLGENPKVVEDKINKDETLCIIADLANGLKHGGLTNSRSGLSPKLEGPGITAKQKDIEHITLHGDKTHIQLKNTNLIKPSTSVVSNKGGVLGEAESIALKAIDSWLIICRELGVKGTG